MKRNLIPWLVILLIVVGLPIVNMLARARAAEATTRGEQQIDSQTVLAGKSIVAAALAAPQEKEKLAAQARALGNQPMQRVAAATLLGELQGPDAARAELVWLRGNPDAVAFDAVYAHDTALPAALAERYEFFAQLAESQGKSESDPQRAAVIATVKRTLLVLTTASVLVVSAGVVGLGLLVTAIVLLGLGKIRPDVAAPTPERSAVYVQAFAIYLATLVLLSLAVEVVVRLVPGVPAETRYLSVVLAVVFGAGWPWVRGVQWAAIREDWGLHRGRGLLVEPLAGVAGYLAGMPIIACGIFVTVMLAKLAGTTVGHPITKELVAHPFAAVLLAVVFAPLTEETLFRGALLSHLRGLWNPWMAALISGVIFAAVHPQGWPAIPALGSIGFVFAMIRQWRRSLIASMTAHALNNGALVTLLLLVGS